MVKMIRVTRNDIKMGVPMKGERCPVARAIRRACKGKLPKGKRFLHASYHYAVFGVKGEWMQDSRALPLKARKFISTFDHRETRKKAKPFSFKLSLPIKA